MKLVTKKITLEELETMAKESFGNFVKAVVDIDKKVMVVDADLHADEEAKLLQEGSSQKNLWGINIYPEKTGNDFLEFDSMINLRPSQGNMSRLVENEEVKKTIAEIIDELIER